MKFKNGKELYKYLTKNTKAPPPWASLTKEAQQVFNKRSKKEIITPEEAKKPELNVWNDWGKNERPPELEDSWRIRVLLRFDAEVIDALGGAENFLNSTEDDNCYRFTDELVSGIENWQVGSEDPTQIYKYLILGYGVEDDNYVTNEPDAYISSTNITVLDPDDDEDVHDDVDGWDDDEPEDDY